MSATEQTSAPGGTGASSGAGQGLRRQPLDRDGDLELRVHAARRRRRSEAAALDRVSPQCRPRAVRAWAGSSTSVDPQRNRPRHADGDATDRILDGGAEIVEIERRACSARCARPRSRATPARTTAGSIEDRNGATHEFGLTEQFRVHHPDHADRPLEWLLQTTRDASGNRIDYGYRRDAGQAYLESVRYARYEVRFDYEDRPDVRHDGRLGFSRWMALRCRSCGPRSRSRSGMSASSARGRSPTRSPRHSGVSLLTGVALAARGEAADGSEDVVRPPSSFGYTGFDPAAFHPSIMQADGAAAAAAHGPGCRARHARRRAAARHPVGARRPADLLAQPRQRPVRPPASGAARAARVIVPARGSRVRRHRRLRHGRPRRRRREHVAGVLSQCRP